MSSPLQFLAPTNPKHLPADKHLVHSKGTAGLVGWLINLTELLRPFGLAGQEFADGVYHDIPPPDINAVFTPSLRRTLPPAINMTTPYESHVPAPPTHPTNPGRDLEEELCSVYHYGKGYMRVMIVKSKDRIRSHLSFSEFLCNRKYSRGSKISFAIGYCQTTGTERKLSLLSTKIMNQRCMKLQDLNQNVIVRATETRGSTDHGDTDT